MCKDTAYPSCRKDFDRENDPTYGQCAIMATLAYDIKCISLMKGTEEHDTYIV